MIEIPIPRFGPGRPPAGKIIINKIVSDYTGTLSCGGKLTPGVENRLRRLKAIIEIHVVSSDSFGTAREQLSAIPLEPHLLTTDEHDEEKREYVNAHEPNLIAAFGNGRNDALMLKAVNGAGGLAIAVDNGEGALSKPCRTLTSSSSVSRTHWISCSIRLVVKRRYAHERLETGISQTGVW